MPENRAEHWGLSGHRYVAVDVLNRLAALEMRARDLVDGTRAGLQRSPYLGASSEFAQHRPYVPGDDVRRVDWRVYARTQRYHVRQYQEETNFVVTFLIDCSASMSYGSGAGSSAATAGTGADRYRPAGTLRGGGSAAGVIGGGGDAGGAVPAGSKLDYACLLTATLSYLVLNQSDAVALALFDRELLSVVPPRTGLNTLGEVATRLETLKVGAGTRLDHAASVLVETMSKRGIVVVLSDLLDAGGEEASTRETIGTGSGRHDRGAEARSAGAAAPESAAARAVAMLRHRRHEVVVFQVMDPQELAFDFSRRSRFEGLELPASVVADPTRLRADYLAIVHDFLHRVRAACVSNGADYCLANTGEPVDHLLVRYLAARQKLREARR